MKRIFETRAAADGRAVSRGRMTGIAGVAVIHVAFVYAFVTGMAQNFAKALPHLLEVQVLPQTEHVEPPPAPALPDVELAAVPEVAAPVIRIERPVSANTITAVQTAKPVIPLRRVLPPQAVAPSAPVGPVSTSATAVAGTHTIPPYPLLARRLSQEGTVRLRIALDERGAVANVTVLRSSGHESLDRAAVEWVTAHWRYRPATQDGRPVGSRTVADIVFDLRKS